MLSATLDFKADLTPLQWMLNGTAHYSAINSPLTSRNIYALAPGLEDVLRCNNPNVPDWDNVGELVKMAVVCKLNLVLGGPAFDTRGVKFTVTKSGGFNDLGYKNVVLAHNTSPHTVNFDIDFTPGAGYGEQAKQLIFKLETYTPGGSSWDFGSGVVQIYQILLTIWYNEATTSGRIDTIRAPIAENRVISAPISELSTVRAPISEGRVISAPVPELRTIRAPIDPDRVIDG